MAINQVINGKNRLVEHPNRYKLNAVSGQANTYDFEKQPGEITEIGTPYAKTILDKIDNVLSYLTPSVEKVESGTRTEIQNIKGKASNVSSQNYSSEYTGENIPINDGTNANVVYKVYKMNNSTSWNSSTANTCFENNVSGSQFITLNYGESDWYVIFKFENIKNVNVSLHSGSTTNGRIAWSNDGITYSNAQALANGGENTFNHSCKSFKIYLSGLSGSLTISNIRVGVEYEVATYQNQFTLDNNGTFTNNQRVLMETPQNAGYESQTFTKSNVIAQSVNTTMTSTANVDIGNIINVSYNSIGTITPSLNITTNANNFTSGTSGETINNTKYDCYNSGHKYNKEDLLATLSKQISTSSPYLALRFYPNNYVDLTFDLGNKMTCTFNFLCKNVTNNNMTLLVSNDNINWETIKTILEGEQVSQQIDNYRYIKVHMVAGNDYEFGGGYIYYCYFSSLESIEYLPIPLLDGVTSNTLNGVDIDTLLQPSTYYEMLYKENDNQFIAEEVRNAN